MTAADFTSLRALWDDAGTPGTTTAGTSTLGDIYKTNMIDSSNIGTLVASPDDLTDPARAFMGYSAFSCGAVSAPYQECYKFQLRDYETEWSEGNVRFEKHQRANFFLMNVRGWKAIYGLFETQTILQGGEVLAAGLALAAATAAYAF